MEVVKNIKKDQIAFYTGSALMCKTCEINLEKVNVLKKYFDFISFYHIKAHEAVNLINEYQIKHAPFFIISINGIVKEIFYSIDDLNLLTNKLLYYKGEISNEK